MSKQNGVFTGPSKTISYLGNHAYAYSGTVPVINADVELLEFTIGKEYMKGKLSVANTSGSGDDIRYYISFNDNIIFGWYFDANNYTGNFDGTPIPLVVPPLTTVKVTGRNLSSSTEREHTAMFKGRVY